MTIETGHGNALANDYVSTAYWYQAGRAARGATTIRFFLTGARRSGLFAR